MSIDGRQELMPLPGKGTLYQRFFSYGWMSILVGAVAMAATYPGRTHGLGMVTEPLLKDLQLSDADGRVLYASLNFWGTLIGAFFCLPVGWLFDRFDRRWILGGNLLLLGLSVLWMSRIETWQQLFFGLILTRGLGQSALSVVSITIVAKSFGARQLGIAMAIYSILQAPFHLILIKGIGWALTEAHFAWREVWGGVGASLMLLSVSAALLVRKPSGDSANPRTIRHAEQHITSSPCKLDAQPIRLQLATPNATEDNHISSSPNSLEEQPPIETEGSTMWQALSKPAFWVFSITISIWGMIYSGVALFNVDIFNERGFDQQLYFNVLSLVTIVALASKLFFGWLVNYVKLTHLLSVCLFVTAASLCGLPFATQTWHAYLYGVGLGIASGAVALIFFATWGKLYGQRELGRIQGVAQMLIVFASASGPIVFAYSKRATTSYSFIFWIFSVVVLMMAIIAWFTPLPNYFDSPKEHPR